MQPETLLDLRCKPKNIHRNAVTETYITVLLRTVIVAVCPAGFLSSQSVDLFIFFKLRLPSVIRVFRCALWIDFYATFGELLDMYDMFLPPQVHQHEHHPQNSRVDAHCHCPAPSVSIRASAGKLRTFVSQETHPVSFLSLSSLLRLCCQTCVHVLVLMQFVIW